MTMNILLTMHESSRLTVEGYLICTLLQAMKMFARRRSVEKLSLYILVLRRIQVNTSENARLID